MGEILGSLLATDGQEPIRKSVEIGKIGRTAVDRRRKHDAERQIKKNDCGPIPPCANPARRDACGRSLRLFLETYFPMAFPRSWSADHLDVITKIETAIVTGGLFAVGMPRGSGKTSLLQRSVIWAIVYGLRKYVFLVCADASKAKDGIRSIKTECEFNPQLYADFPEVCKPIRALQGSAQGGRKQHVDGTPTLIDWRVEAAQFPHVAGSLAAGALIKVGGITGAARGAQVTLPSGEVWRPSLILVDDFQTRESAASPTQCRTRLDTLVGDLCGMRGPGEPLAMLVAANCIYEGDAFDQLLDRKKYPEFHGVRKKLIYEWPTDQRAWDHYIELRKQAQREDREPTEANSHYAKHRSQMDAGAVVAWPERKNANEVSAVQHVYNLKVQHADTFEAEFQNTPRSREVTDVEFLKPDAIAEKLTNRPGDELPATITHVNAAIDVQGNSLWWSVVAWGEGFSGNVVAYDVFPKQGRRFFSQRDLPHTFLTMWPSLSEEEAIFRALSELTADLLSRRWRLDSGAELGISRLLIDEGYKAPAIHQFCNQTTARELITPAKGWGIQAAKLPMNDWPPKPGETVGANWRVRLAPGNRVLRHVLWDSNHWKTFIHERLVTQPGGRGCLQLCGMSPMEHRLLAAHLTAEYPTRTQGRGRTVIEWNLKPARPDNHWFDTLAMCAVGASMCGLELVEGETPKRKRTVMLNPAELQANQRRHFRYR